MFEPDQVLRPLTVEDLTRTRPRDEQSYENLWAQQACVNEALTLSEIGAEKLFPWNFVFRQTLEVESQDIVIDELTDWTISLEHKGTRLYPDGHETMFTAPAVYVCLAHLEDAHDFIDKYRDATCARFTGMVRFPF